MSDDITITEKSAKFYCRTCLIKLEMKEADEKTNFVDISDNLELQEMLTLNIEMGSAAAIADYPRCICISCNKKLQSFASFIRKAKQSANTLLIIFRETHKLKKENCVVENNERPIAWSTRKRLKLAVINDVPLETELVTLLDDANQNEVEKLENSKTDPFFDAEPLLSPELKDENNSDSVDTSVNVEINSNGANKNDIESDNSKYSSTSTKPKTEKKKSAAKKHDDSYRCVECKKRFVLKCHYDAHILNTHKGSTRPYACDQCDKTYKTLNSLRYHVNAVHKNARRIISCEECGKCCKTLSSLRYHRLSFHLGEKQSKNFVCDICDAAFFHAKTLLIHNKAKHAIGDEEGSEYKCADCHKLFQSPYTLKYHMLRYHMQEKNYKCEVCEVDFAKKFMLTLHMKVHASDSEKIPCNHCGKRYHSKSDLKKHVRIVHLKLKPHTCEYCGISFGTFKSLRHHIFIHTGEKPYGCNICEQHFRHHSAMKRHQKTHFKKVTESSTENLSIE